MTPKKLYFFFGAKSPLATTKRGVERNFCKFDSFKIGYLVAQCLEHSLDLMIFSFKKRDEAPLSCAVTFELRLTADHSAVDFHSRKELFFSA